MLKKILSLAYPIVLLVICACELPQVKTPFATIPKTYAEMCVSLLHLLVPLAQLIIVIWIVGAKLELPSYLLCIIISLIALAADIYTILINVLYVILLLFSMFLSYKAFMYNRKKNVELMTLKKCMSK